jgi:alpha-L-fucosidase
MMETKDRPHMKCRQFIGRAGVFALSAVALLQAHAIAGSGDTSWMLKGKYGIFVHYQYRILLGYSVATTPQFPKPSEMTAGEWNRLVDGFDVDGFANQVAEARAGWVIFCIDDHYFAWPCAPNKAFDKYTGYAPAEKCARRDLIVELAHALNAKGVKLICYFAGLNGYMKEPRVSAGLVDDCDWNTAPSGESRKRRLEVLEEYADRYKDTIAGWWFDGVDPDSYKDKPDDWATIDSIVHRANPRAVIAFSYGGNEQACVRKGIDDYTGGDTWSKQQLSRLTPATKPAQGGILWHGKIYCGNVYHGQGDANQFSDQELIDWISTCNSQGGVCTLDWPLDPKTGLIKDFGFAQLKRIARAVKADEPAPKRPVYQPDWESLDQRPVAPWWLDAKFGIYVHWSLASVPGWGNHSSFYWPNLLKSRQFESTGPRPAKNDIAEEYVGLWQFHARNYGRDFQFPDFAPMFRAEAFDADHWAEVFARSQAKYVVLTAKHHDGFCLWPSAEASRTWGRPWNAMDVGPKQDLVGNLTAAVRRRGLRMGFYYSFFEWYNPLWLTDRPRFVRDHMQPQLRDLVTRYKPDILWADGEWDGPESLWKSREFLAWLFNESLASEIVINDRWGQGSRHRHGGFYTTEFTPGMRDGSHPWEENRTMTRPRAYDAEDRPLWYDWVFNRQLALANYDSARELVLTLVDTVSRGGNLLLNVGPTPDGRLRVIEEERLSQIGDWLKVNGEAIFGTRPWVKNCQWTSGERPRIEYDREWRYKYDIAVLTRKPSAGRAAVEAFFTAKGNTLYAILPRWRSGSLVLEDVRPSEQTVVTMLGSGKALKWRPIDGGIVVELPQLSIDELPCEHAYTIKLAHVEGERPR